MTRIAVVCPYSIDRRGGVQGQALGLSREYASRGHDVALFAPGERALHVDGVELHLLGPTIGVPANRSRAPVAPSPSSYLRTARGLGLFSPDVIHVHEPLVPAPSLAALLSGHAPVVATFHRAGTGISYRLLRPLSGPLARRISLPIAVSLLARDTALALFGDHFEQFPLIENGIDPARFSAGQDELQADVPAAIFIGRHEQRKGLAILLEAFSSISEPAKLWVVGDGPESARLRSRYEKDARIVFLGELDDDALASRLSSAQVMVAPALSGESFGVVLIEAMAAGTAVLCSDIPGYRSAGEGAARFFPPGDPSSLRESLETLLMDPTERGELVIAGRIRAQSLSFEEIASRYLSHFEQLTSD